MLLHDKGPRERKNNVIFNREQGEQWNNANYEHSRG